MTLIVTITVTPKIELDILKKESYHHDMISGHSFSYRGLWKLLIDKSLSRKQLQDGTGLSNNVMSRLSHGEGVSLETLARICDYLECDLADLRIEVLDDSNKI